MKITSSEQLIVNTFYWVTFKRTGDETIGQWDGQYFMVVGSDEYVHLSELSEIWHVCMAKVY